MILARLRLPAILGGDPNLAFDVLVMNDTGSNIQSVLPTDLAALHYNPFTYLGNLGAFALATANGLSFRGRILIEVQIVKADGTPITPWYQEIAVITPQPVIQYRLSGSGMRNHLYFATAPGNTILVVAEKTNGITNQLPVM